MTPSRRDVLKVAGLAASGVGAAGLVGCSSQEEVKAGPASIPAADVPVGGGKVVTGTNFVVTQPTKGTYRAFTRTCPHAGCNVNQVNDTGIVCPCHGSTFSIKDGSVTQGPATSGLGAATVKVQGQDLAISGS